MKIILVLLYLITSCSLYAETVSLGYINLPPHIYEDHNKQLKGPLVTLLNNHIAPQMEVTFSYVKMPLARIFSSLERGQINGIAIAGSTQERRAKLFYPKNNFYHMQPAIILLKEKSKDTFRWPEDLKKLEIGSFKSAIVSPYMETHHSSFIDIYGNNTWSRNIKRLTSMRLDAIYTPIVLNAQYLCKNNEDSARFRIIKTPDLPLNLYTVFSKQELADRYDIAFKKTNGNERYVDLITPTIKELSLIKTF